MEAGIALVGATVLGACGDKAAYSNAPAVGAATATTPAAPTGSAVPQSLAFSAPRVGGGSVDLATYAGKPVLLWFWAPT